LKTKARLIRLLAYHTGQTEQQILKDSDRDFWMSAQEAQKYGIVDNVVEFRQGSL
jgi:ATP-dependent Clp protease protease subunit